MSEEANPEKMPKNNPWQTRCVIFGVVCALVIGIFAWSAEPGELELISSEARDAYYNLLVQGFQSGQLNVKRDPAPGLAALPNPYDPSANMTFAWDIHHLAYEMSYYKGKLYLYFGVTPALVLFWPYEILTGHYLDHTSAVVIFFAVGFLVAAGLLYTIWRRYFPDARTWAAIAGLLAVGLASGIPAMLSACDVYEVAKSCAYAFTMLALGAIWRALHDSRRQVLWSILASLAYGLAMGARPSLVFGAVILLVPIARAWQGAAPGSRLRTAPLFLAAVVPITLIGSGLMVYNYLRFGSPSEFGWHYQLTSYQNHGAQQFGLGYLWFNFRFYFLQPMGWTGQFPFLKALQPPPFPAGYYGIESRFAGVLIDYPIVWLALAAPLAWKGRAADEISELRWFAAAIFLFFLASVLTLCLFFAAGSGYLSDFLPALMFLAALGIFGLERTLKRLPGWRWIARCGWSLLLIFSIGVNALAGAESHAIAHSHNGDFLISEGRLDEARVQFEKTLAIWPEYAGAYCGLGAVLLQKGQIAEAIVQCQKALEYDPTLYEAVSNLGYCYLKTGRMNDAIVLYQKFIEMEPDFPQARIKLAVYLLQAGRTDDAIAQYQKVVELKPDSETYQCYLGNAYLQKGLIAEGMAQYKKALEIKPDFAQAHTCLAYCLFRTGRTDDAIAEYQKAIELDPQSATYHGDLGNILLQKGDVDGAITQYQTSLALDPKSAEVFKRLANALFQKGQLKEAILEYQKALEINPNFAEAVNNLGYCYLQAGQVDDAITQFEKVTELQPNFAPEYANLGDAFRRKGAAGEAIANYQKAIELRPQFTTVMQKLAWILATWPDASIRNGTKAVALAEQANELTRGRDAGILRTLAAAYAETGRYAEAVSTAKEALALATGKSDTAVAGRLEQEIGTYQSNAPCRSQGG
jgi:tetratricopeptide (TPR) repeat protein